MTHSSPNSDERHPTSGLPFVPPEMYPIRLQGPWEVRMDVHSPESARIRLPISWQTLNAPAGTSVHLARRFQSPTGLTGSDRVLLLFPSGGVIDSTSFNGQPLLFDRTWSIAGSSDASSVPYWIADLTELLQPTNRLELNLSVSLAAAPPLSEAPSQSPDSEFSSGPTGGDSGFPNPLNCEPQLQHPVIIGILPSSMEMRSP